jgi:transcriptional regulator with XRE-family HTH domain
MGRKRANADIRERFGFAIRQRREELGLTQEQVASRAGISRTYLGEAELGQRNVALINIERISGALDLALPELFRRIVDEPEEDPPPEASTE